MQANEIRLGVLSAVLGGVLVAGIGTLTMNRSSADAKVVSPEPAPVQTVIVNAPEVVVPGYLGALYDAQGRVVGVAVEKKAAAAAQLANAGGGGAATATAAPQGRSKAKSAAIIAGSAGAGAAIGAIAGGGKGAAIGAISGGTAGVIYDRTTANKKR
jgi:hypothetical protein